MASAVPNFNAMSEQQLREYYTNLQNDLAETRRKVSGYIDSNTGHIVEIVDLRDRILQKVSGVYDRIAVEQIQHLFPGEKEKVPTRKIILKRTWSKWDTVPFVPFLSALFVKDSIYGKMIDKNSLAEYVLDAKVPETPFILDRLFNEAREAFRRRFPTESSENIAARINGMVNIEIKNLAENQKNNQDIENTVAGLQGRELSPETLNDVRIFLENYNKVYDDYCGAPKMNLRAAYWQSKTITILVPNDLSRNADVEVSTSGIITPFVIKLGKETRQIFMNG